MTMFTTRMLPSSCAVAKASMTCRCGKARSMRSSRSSTQGCWPLETVTGVMIWSLIERDAVRRERVGVAQRFEQLEADQEVGLALGDERREDLLADADLADDAAAALGHAVDFALLHVAARRACAAREITSLASRMPCPPTPTRAMLMVLFIALSPTQLLRSRRAGRPGSTCRSRRRARGLIFTLRSFGPVGSGSPSSIAGQPSFRQARQARQASASTQNCRRDSHPRADDAGPLRHHHRRLGRVEFLLQDSLHLLEVVAVDGAHARHADARGRPARRRSPSSPRPSASCPVPGWSWWPVMAVVRLSSTMTVLAPRL